MSDDPVRSDEEIELHFCVITGKSIPAADIESGRAVPVPGGYVSADHAYLARDQDLAERRLAGLASPTPRATAPAPSGGGGGRVLVTVALLYLVGVSTYLLVLEMKRKPPTFPPASTFASTRDVRAVSDVVEQLDEKARRALAQLKENDEELRALVTRVDEQLKSIERAGAQRHEELQAEDDKLMKEILSLTDRTIGLKRDFGGILGEMRDDVRKLNDRPIPTAGNTPAAPAQPNTPAAPPLSKEEQERQRLAREYIAQLQDKNAEDQTRYNAAIQLGDLKAPEAVEPLMNALQNDSYNLVKRGAAWALGMLGKDAVKSIPVLIAQIGGKEEYVGYMCERALGDITKAVLGTPKKFNFDPTMSQRERRQIQKKWEAWWEENKQRLLPSG